MGDLGSIFLLALLAMFTPALLAAVTVMMLLPSPRRLMFGYLLGAYLTSISVGLLIVFSLHDSASVETTKSTLSPAADLVLGLILVVVAYVLYSDRDARLRERRRRKREEKESSGTMKQSWPERLIGKGDPRLTFVAGVLLSFPGVSYLTALDRTAKLDASAPETVAIVVGFCLIQLALIEVPLIGYLVAPDKTADRVSRFRAWLGRNGRRAGIWLAAVLGGLLLVRGVLELILG